MFYGLIIKFIVPIQGKLLNPKKTPVNINMLIPTTLAQIHVFNDMTKFHKECGYSIG
jgi:hypothetical protein